MSTNLELTAVTQLEEADKYGKEYGIPARAILAYWNNGGNEWDDIANWIDDCVSDYIGEAEGWNYQQWLGFQMEELGIIDVEGMLSELRFYFDYEKYGRDLELGGDVWSSDGFYFFNR
jgi:antirestriction protein